MHHCALKGQFTQSLKSSLTLARVVSMNADSFVFMCFCLMRTVSASALYNTDDKQPLFKVTAISIPIGKS